MPRKEAIGATKHCGASIEGLWNSYGMEELKVILDFLERATAALCAHADSMARTR